jgi:endoglucanase
MRRSWPTILAAAGITLATTIPVVATASAASAASAVPEVRVNQVGYPTSAAKVAFVMLARPVKAVTFEVPGTEWKSDMAWGAAEIALADEATGAPAGQLNADLATAARWARAYIAQGHPADGDTFNLYDNGAVAEAELLQAMQQAGSYPIAPGALLGDLAAQLRTGEDWAKGDPFALGTQLGASDASPHAFGLFITDALYQKYGGSDQYAAFAQQQLNFALGANAWGSSFVVGAGTVFPHCMQSEIANLAGSLTGSGDIQLGATTDGPSSIGNFSGLGTVPGMRACSAGNFAPFNTATAGYEDNVVSWPSVEPADDYTAASLFAFALAAAEGSGLG